MLPRGRRRIPAVPGYLLPNVRSERCDDSQVFWWIGSFGRIVTKDQYYFGTLLKQVDVFAFPRTGSHLLAHCFAGLFDSISLLPEVHRTSPEAISRQDEIKTEALYALELREPGVPFRPVWLNPLTGGVHGTPMKSNNPALLLIRDPIATAFSAWRARRRLGFILESPDDLNDHLESMNGFMMSGLTCSTVPVEGCFLSATRN